MSEEKKVKKQWEKPIVESLDEYMEREYPESIREDAIVSYEKISIC